MKNNLLHHTLLTFKQKCASVCLLIKRKEIKMKNINKQINLVIQIAVIALAIGKLLDMVPDAYDLVVVLVAIFTTKRLIK